MKIHIMLDGCDDTTHIELGDKDFDGLNTREICEMLKQLTQRASTYGCQPIIDYYVEEE